MIELRFLGGCREVGRMGILVDTGAEKFLWEYGINVESWGKPIQPEINFDRVFVSHAHLDHSGLLPQLYNLGYGGAITADPATFDLLSILLRDSLKLQKRECDNLDFTMDDIRQLEKNKRGYYGGAVMYLTVDGQFDSCITIRSLQVRDHTAYIRVGAGIVHDSIPKMEFEETEHKAGSCLRAIRGR